VDVLGGVDPLDRYRLERPVAVVGSDTVWLAEDARLHRRVAVREVVARPREGETSASARARFAREARTAARLVSGPIVTVYDVVETTDAVYVVTEFIDAPTLRESVHESGLLSAGAAASLGLHILQAISYAHAHNVTHGRINPSNVSLFRDGTVKVAEFGMSNDGGSTDGTAPDHYRAPEVAEGSPAGPATDFWCLGATLHYARYGTAPGVKRVTDARGFQSSGAARLDKIVSDLLDEDPARRPNAAQLRRRLLAVGPAARRRAASVDPRDAAMAEPQLVPATIPTEAVAPHRHGRRILRVAVAAAVVLLLCLAYVGLTGADSSRTVAPPSTSSSPVTVGSIVARTLDGTVATTARPPTSTITMTPSTSVPNPSRTNAPPAGWVAYRDDASGYKIARPQNWTIRPVTPYRTDFVDPASGAFIRIEWTDQPGPDPVEAWRAQARLFEGRVAAYEELRIDPATFKGHKAAEWEFRYLERGALRHALDIGLITGRYGAALFAVAPEPLWQSFQATLEHFRTSFEPPV
jgi:eukaryotic-like serine/threonine-protein kinase